MKDTSSHDVNFVTMWSRCLFSCSSRGMMGAPSVPSPWFCPLISFMLSWSKADQLSSLSACLLSEPEAWSCSLVSCQWLDLSSLYLFSRLHTQSKHTETNLHSLSFKPEGTCIISSSHVLVTVQLSAILLNMFMVHGGTFIHHLHVEIRSVKDHIFSIWMESCIMLESKD